MYKLFSQRKKEAEGNMSDVYLYDEFPESFRNQFLIIVDDVLDCDSSYETRTAYEFLGDNYCREKGLKSLFGEDSYSNSKDALSYYVDHCSNEDFLDLLDFVFAGIFVSIQDEYPFGAKVNKAFEELNFRFNQHSLGYEFINDNLIVKTNEQIHREIVKPAIALLNNPEFAGAEQEYFEAFDCYKKGNSKDAITNANKAFESTMKSICDGMGYKYNASKDTAKNLIKILEDKNFYPAYLNNFITNIRTTLESGAPTVRNKTSGHGQGPSIVKLQDEYVEYALNLVATNIVFLVKLYNEKKAGN